jgi:hypothetical protein
MRSPLQFISAIVLMSALSLGSGIPLLQASAAPMRHPAVLLTTNYPKALSWRVRKDLARRVGIPTTELRITQAERKTWGNGCLELPRADEFCTQQLVEGWQVVVAHENQTWVYHTDLQGRSLRLAETSQPAPLPKNAVFRSRSTGGFAGQTYEVILFNDGSMQQRINVTDQKVAPVRSWRISPNQVKQFRNALQNEHFERFDHKTYSAPNGAADFFIITLTSPTGTVEYADIEVEKLPRALQTIIQAWNSLK